MKNSCVTVDTEALALPTEIPEAFRTNKCRMTQEPGGHQIRHPDDRSAGTVTEVDTEMNSGFQQWAPLTALVRGSHLERRHLTAALIIGKRHRAEPFVSQAQTMATPGLPEKLYSLVPLLATVLRVNEWS